MIEKFIWLFHDFRLQLSNGLCYWFAQILTERFGGDIVYAPIENHFLARIDGRLYDSFGDVTGQYPVHVSWFDYQLIDPIHSARITRDCINIVHADMEDEYVQ